MIFRNSLLDQVEILYDFRKTLAPSELSHVLNNTQQGTIWLQRASAAAAAAENAGTAL